jgi:hypothetical protein
MPSTKSARKTIAIIQSCYIPWRGFFDFMDEVDEFILYDDVQFVKRHWHNRNKIKTSNGSLWLSIPVETKGKFAQDINETMIAGSWTKQHWRSIQNAYAKAPHFPTYGPMIESLYERAATLAKLSEVNRLFLDGLNQIIGIATPIRWSTEFTATGRKTDRLLSICKANGADGYKSGPSARSYMEPEKFEQAGITLTWMNYNGYREYPQIHGAFEPAVSILDLLLNTGPDALSFIRRDMRKTSRNE